MMALVADIPLGVKRQKVDMNNQLEYSVIHGCIVGYLSPLQLKPHIKGFSKEGKCVYQAIKWLLDQGEVPPFKMTSVQLTCIQVFGFDAEAITKYLEEMQACEVGQETPTVIAGALNKFKLLELQAALNDQVATRCYQPEKIQDILLETNHAKASSLVSLADKAKTWGKEEDYGATIIALGDRFKQLQDASGGLSGMWVIGGLPGVGKSTLAWQFGLICASHRPVLYYDMENTERRLYERTVRAFNRDPGEADQALRRVFVRQNTRAIFGEVQELGVEAVIIIDSLQKLPTDVHVKRETMEDWLQRLDKLKQQGHIIIIVSQLNRSEGNYKGTNDIEHTADFGVKLESSAEDPGVSDVWIEKNRHGPKLGYLCTLKRENVWLMRE